MKRSKIVAALLLIIVIMASTCSAFGASASRIRYTNAKAMQLPGSAFGASASRIPGIDYKRITQQADGGRKSYPVVLEMGPASFTGFLTENYALSIEDLNEIIEKTMEKTNMSSEQLIFAKELGRDIEGTVDFIWLEQVMTGIISYLPFPESDLNGLVGWDDFFKLMVYGTDATDEQVEEYGKGKAVDAAYAAAERGINAGTEYLSKIGKFPVSKIPMLGQVLNTIKVSADWTSGNKKLDDFLKKLESKIEDVNKFYSEVSRRANELVDEKGTDTYRIEFGESSHCTYKASFWETDNITMNASVFGTLEPAMASDSYAATYTGRLTFVVEAKDLSPVENNLYNTQGLSEIKANLSAAGGFASTGNTGKKTLLRRTTSADVNITVRQSDTTGKQELVPFFNFIHGTDDIVFSLERDLQFVRDNISVTTVNVHCVSDDPASVSWNADSHSTVAKFSVDGADSKTAAQNVGTVWAPIDAAPYIYLLSN